MKVVICDICGENMEKRMGTPYVIKKKRGHYINDWYKLDVCDLCMENIEHYITKEREAKRNE